MSRKLKSLRKNQVQLIAHHHPKEIISEQYRILRSNILFSSVDREIKSIMVTSPEPSDGKSTTAMNLATVLAQQEKQILLVDADLRKPSVHYGFKVNNIDGLTSVLTKKINLDEAIIKTYVPNLSILTSGPIPPNPAELLDSKAMEKVMEEIKDMYDYVIIDTPPVLAVTDPQIMANKCDGVVFVVARGKTHKERSIRAKELLENAKSQLLGVVINGVTKEESSYYQEYK